MEQQLQNLGLTKTESKIYITLLNLGSSLAGIIARKSGIHRRTVYDVLDKLTEKGLIGYITKNNRKYYEINNPEKLKELIKEKEQTINQILPLLKQKYNTQKEKQETLVFKGKEAIKKIFQDQLNYKEILVLAGEGASEVLSFYLKHYNNERIKRKIKLKIVSNEKHEKLPFTQEKVIKNFKTFTSTNIYGNNVAIIIWKQQPLAILIKEKEIADSYKNYFEIIWKSGKI